MSRSPVRNHVPLLAGWLFADLLLALALVFLGSERPAVVDEEPAPDDTEVAVDTEVTTEGEEDPPETTKPAPPPGLEPVRYTMVWDDEATRAAVRSAATDESAAIGVRDAVGRWLQDEGLDDRQIGILLIFTNPGGGSTSTALSDDVAAVICQYFGGNLGLTGPIEGEGLARCGPAASFVRPFFTPGDHGRLEIELWAYP